jgi:hypothetical protein
MSDMVAIIRATRQSAAAVESMAKWEREIRHAEKSIAWHAMQKSRGLMSPACASQLDTIASADIIHATRCLKKARGRYDSAQSILSRNPI